jgi:MFS family permease
MSSSGAELLTRPGRAAWLRDVTSSAWRSLALGGLGWMFDVYDNFMLALTIPALVIAFALSKAEAGAIGSILAAGLVLGGIGFGWVADRIGRVRTLMLCVTIYSVFSGTTAFVTGVMQLGLVRFLAGLGMGGAWTAGAALVAETWHPAHRGKGGALMQIGLPLGSMLAVAVVTVVNAVMGGLDGQGWKIVYLTGFLPMLVIIPLGLRTPESPMWLERRRVAAVAERPSQLAAVVGRGYLSRLSRALGFIFFAQYIYWGVFTWTPSFLVSAKHFAFVRSLEFTMAQQIGSLLGFLVFASLVDRFGRRPAFLLYLAVGAGAVGWLVLGTTPLAIMAAMFLSGFGITGIFAGLGPLTAELAPPDAGRAFFMGLAYNGGRLGGILAPFLIGALATTDANFMLGMATAIPAFLFAAIILFTIPETKGLRLT